MTFSSVIEAPEITSTQSLQGENWSVVVYNNDKNTYEEVMTVLMLATHCSAEEAYIEAWEIDHYGLCAVHRGSEDVCQQVAKVIATIGIRTEVEQSS